MKPRIWLANFLECLPARLRAAPAEQVGPFVTITSHGGAGEGGIKLAIIALAERLSKLDERKNEVR